MQVLTGTFAGFIALATGVAGPVIGGSLTLLTAFMALSCAALSTMLASRVNDRTFVVDPFSCLQHERKQANENS